MRETTLERDGRLNVQAWEGTLHRLIAAQRGISLEDISSESGIPPRSLDRHLAGQKAGFAESVDDALTRISERRGFKLEPAIRVRGPLLADGLPLVVEVIDEAFISALRDAREERS